LSCFTNLIIICASVGLTRRLLHCKGSPSIVQHIFFYWPQIWSFLPPSSTIKSDDKAINLLQRGPLPFFKPNSVCKP
jgi:hypothetical protein